MAKGLARQRVIAGLGQGQRRSAASKAEDNDKIGLWPEDEASNNPPLALLP